MLSLLLLACNQGPNNPTSPLPMDMIQVFFDMDPKAVDLELAEMKKDYSVGSVETVKVWDQMEGEETEVSFVALMKGSNKVGILAYGDADTERKELEKQAQDVLDGSFSAPSPANPSALMDNDAAKAAGIVGITLEQCVSEWIANRMEIDQARMEKECEEFSSPDSSWYKYQKEKLQSDLADEIERLKDMEASEERIEAKEDYEKYLKGQSDEDYISSIINTRRNQACLSVELISNEAYYFMANVSNAIQECSGYITYLAEFERND